MTLVYLAIAWALGIWLARVASSAGWMSCHAPGPATWAALLLLAATGLLLSRRRVALRLPMALLCFLLLGGLRYQLHPFQPCFSATDLAHYNGSSEQPSWATVTGVIIRPPEERDTRVRIRLRGESVALARSESGQSGEQGEPRPVRGDALFTVDRSPELRYGDRVQVRGRLEEPPVFEGFNYKEYLARAGVHTMIQRPAVVVLGRNEGSVFWRTLYRIREQGQAVIGRLLPEPEAALLTGILLGVETGIDPALYDEFNRTGTSHIIVISGFNITIIAGLFTATLGRVVGQRRAFYPVLAGIILYTLLVGADAAVTRAAVMGILYAWAVYLGRQSTAVVSLFAAGLIMTLLNPLSLWDVGFQLSFMATLSLILFTPALTGHFERLVGRLLPAGIGQKALNLLNDALIVTLAATILTLPLVAYYFGRVSVVSPLANLLVLPVQPYVMIWGGSAVIVGVISQLLSLLWPLARLLALIPWLALHWTVLVVQALASLPFAAINVQPSLAALWGWYALVAVLTLADRPGLPVLSSLAQRVRAMVTSSAAITVSAAGLLVAGSLLFSALRSLPDGQLHVHFLDVGRGEAVLIDTPDGQQVLIDGGYSPTALLSALSEHIPFYDRQIELVVLTHPGDERIGGLVGLAERYEIKQVLQAPFPYPSANYESWLRSLQRQGVPITPAEAGTRIHLGYGATLDVLHPGPEPMLKKDGDLDLKANSLVLRLSYGETSFLLTGDVPAEVQEELVQSGVFLESTVVKLPDGGRQAAFSEAFLMATRPEHAVVFVQSEDRFRDLSAAVEDAWEIVVGPEGFHRTDLAGTVSFASNGHALWPGIRDR